MTEIYVIRHVQAEGNLYRHMQGHWDGDVTALGVRQRDALAERFRHIPVDTLWSSDLYRARFTATAITKYHPLLTIQTDERLREINVGPWEAVPFANAIWEQPALFETFLHDPEHFYLEGAETYAQVQTRTLAALREIAEANPDRTVVITSHGIAIRCMLTALMGVPLSDTETVPIFANTGVAHLSYADGRFTVDWLNDASHLSPDELSIPDRRPALRHVCIDPAEHREFYEQCYSDSWQNAHGNLDGFRAATYYEAALAHHRADPESVMLLYYNDEPAGLLDLDPERGRSAGYGWISLLYLLPKFRGRGLGVQVLGRATAHFESCGRTALRLQAAEENTAAMAFYKKWGFVPLSWTQGAHGRLWLMEKKLRGHGHGLL